MAAAVAWIRDAPARARQVRPVRRLRAPNGRGPDAESRCAALARGGGALRRALCALAGRFVEQRAWEKLGYARAGDYARERLGRSARELRDLARVDVALRTLPACEAALVAGTLPWTKPRSGSARRCCRRFRWTRTWRRRRRGSPRGSGPARACASV